MLLTYKVKHNKDFTAELKKARQVAEFGVKHKTVSSKDVKQFGLKSAISVSILWKYVRNKNIKHVKNVKLEINSQSIKFNCEKRTIHIVPLKFEFNYWFRNDFNKINWIEIDSEYVYITVTVPDEKPVEPAYYIGVDLNATGHMAVVSNPQTGKVMKLGKKAGHIHNKYKNIRRRLQKKKKYKALKKIKHRESNIIRDLNHKISRKIVDEAKKSGAGIKLEDLRGIRQKKNKKTNKRFRYSLNSWAFYQLQTMIEYKSKLLGVPVVYVAPQYTSQICSRCGHMGNRNGKVFKCPVCGHVDNADVNAAFNIALRPSDYQLRTDRDVRKGSTAPPHGAIPDMSETPKPFR
ncbi:MAG: transposase [Candidatus Parvarchaeota archaeon]